MVGKFLTTISCACFGVALAVIGSSAYNTIHERPSAANERLEIGHWEADTVAGKTGRARIVTLVDRRSRFSLLGKVEKKISKNVVDCMINLLRNVGEDKCKTVTPDRGKEFSQHSRITLELNGTKVYFPDPHAPWQRGTNENTNGLLREYSPKGEDISGIFDSQIQDEEIPREIVIMLDGSDLAYSPDQPPQFVCEDCGGAMSPVYYRNKLGYEFRLEDK